MRPHGKQLAPRVRCLCRTGINKIGYKEGKTNEHLENKKGINEAFGI